MQIAKLYGPENIRVTDEEKPTLEPGTIRVDVAYTGVCGSDVHEYKIGPVPIRAEDSNHNIPEQEWDEYLPKNMGHEITGTVVDVADNVEDIDVGDQVALNILLSCGECRYCQDGKPQLCTAYDGTESVVRVSPRTSSSLQSLEYRSQRTSQCGMLHSPNRLAFPSMQFVDQG